jgi:2-C-methyl-D-erythritol 2,4-cyclodiphosphate synthase
LILGGVDVPYQLGLEGWSDADVLVHALINALLGAAALGDIGTYFPYEDPAYKDASSLALLEQVKAMLENDGWQIGNIDATILAEKPRLLPYIDEMRQCISQTLGVDKEQIGIKASSADSLGFVGRGEGIGACAVALIERKEQ